MTTTVGDARQLGAAIRQARVQLGLSQAELATDAKVGRQWLVGLEAGDKGSAPLNMVLRVLAALGQSVVLDPGAARPPASSSRPPVAIVITAEDILARYTLNPSGAPGSRGPEA
ncbi:MAG: helix-turn-helix domain-containing protein [Bifidobacteriaceae bacterium]|jgi:transcriptional regulator with XRE-family HTH domain|nr:helix-turn-helix domain-containing protein [Bifidobacteriaceae bacterium]